MPQPTFPHPGVFVLFIVQALLQSVRINAFEICFLAEGIRDFVEIDIPELKCDDLNSYKTASRFWVFTELQGLPPGVTGHGNGFWSNFDTAN